MPTENILKAALILMVVFFLLFGGLGFYFMSQVGSREKPGSLERILADKRAEKVDLKDEIANLKVRVEEKVREAEEKRWQKELVEDHLARLRRARKGYQTLKDMREAHHSSVKQAHDRISDALERGETPASPSLQALRREKEKYELEYTRRRNELRSQSDEITNKLRKESLRYDRRHEDKRKVRDTLETQYVQIREELQNYMIRDPPDVDKSYDGVVLTVDIESRQAVMNIGKRHGVRRGMRFEVFRLRHGSRRVHKGFLVVRRVDRETANCIILDKAMNLPRCPGDGYTARYPEERFCPYCSGRGVGGQVQRLTAIPKETNLGMNRDDPMVADDRVQNPMFDPGTRLHFVLKGDQDEPLSEMFRTEDFVAAIRWHGGVVDPELSSRTDVLLAGKYAMDEVRKARELGVRVLRQYELFNFLRK